MDEARRVLGAVPAAASSATASPRQSNSHESSPLPPQQPVPSPLATTTHLAPTNQSARRSPSQPAIPPAPGSSSMFANPISYNSLPPSNAYSSNPAANFPLAPSQPSGSSAPTEKPVTSADLLEQARALRRNATATAQKSAAPGGGGAPQTNSSAPVQPPPTTSPPQETSSTPQESVTASIPAPAPVVEAFSKPKSPSTATSNLSAPPDGLQPAIGTNGNNSTFSTSPSHLGLVLARNEHKRNVTESRKRKNDEVDTPNEAAKSRTRTRDRSMSNLEAPVVGQQTNEPHFNPFEITHFLPFTTAAPSIVPSPDNVATASPRLRLERFGKVYTLEPEPATRHEFDFCRDGFTAVYRGWCRSPVTGYEEEQLEIAPPTRQCRIEPVRPCRQVQPKSRPSSPRKRARSFLVRFNLTFRFPRSAQHVSTRDVLVSPGFVARERPLDV